MSSYITLVNQNKLTYYRCRNIIYASYINYLVRLGYRIYTLSRKIPSTLFLTKTRRIQIRILYILLTIRLIISKNHLYTFYLSITIINNIPCRIHLLHSNNFENDPIYDFIHLSKLCYV